MIIKKTDEYTIYKKRSGRYEVIGLNKKNINGIDKSRILASEKLIEFTEPKKPAEQPVEESEAAPEPAEQPAEESDEKKSD